MLKEILDILYPRKCYICNIALIHNNYLCFSCWRKIALVGDNFCLRCGNVLGNFIGVKNRCTQCKGIKFSFNEVRVGGEYKGLLKRLVYDFKYNSKIELQYLLAAIIKRQIKKYPFSKSPEIIISVPMSFQDEKKRGYNQTKYIANILSKYLKIVHYPWILKKVKKTRKQSHLSYSERKNNLKNAFQLSKKETLSIVKGKHILLIDDILTTGTTLNECASILRKAKVKKIFVATIARPNISNVNG